MTGAAAHDAASQPPARRDPDAGVSLERVRPVLALFFLALTGHDVTIAVEGPGAVADPPRAVSLPERMADLHTAAGNRQWYVVAVAHRALSLLAKQDAAAVRGRLAFEVFRTLEDARIDAQLARQLPGLAPGLAAMRRRYAVDLVPAAPLPPRDHYARLITLASLGAPAPAKVPAVLAEPVGVLLAACARISEPDSTPVDTLACAAAVYRSLRSLPNLMPADARQGDVPDVAAGVATIRGMTAQLEPDAADVVLEDSAGLEVHLERVPYRQPLQRHESGARLTDPGREEIFVFGDSAGDDSGDAPVVEQRSAQNEELRRPEPLPHDHGVTTSPHQVHAPSQPLTRRSPDEHLYPEWDQTTGRQRPAWVRVVERPAPRPSRSSGALASDVAAHRAFVHAVRRRLERLHPSGVVQRRGQRWGELLDVEAAIRAIVDARAGAPPADTVYRSLQRDRRDVAVAVLIDSSASTAERSGERADDDHRGGFARPALARKGYRTVLDVQRDAVAIIGSALDALGDALAIYAFSGRGRDNVAVTVVKDFAQRMGPPVLDGLEALRPDRATRMGAAIRHVTRRLAARDETTRLMIVVSDGRPYDVDYGAPSGDHVEYEPEYAVADTLQALREAAGAGVVAGVLDMLPDEAPPHDLRGVRWRSSRVADLGDDFCALYGDLLQ